MNIFENNATILSIILVCVLFLGLAVQGGEKPAEENEGTAVPAIDRQQYKNLETATFALGCFWGPDARFGAIPGVVRTRVGYAGGTKEDPTYKNLGDHTESVQIDFNPKTITYEDLLEVFWNSHDPTRRSYGKQYRTILFFHDEKQRDAANQSKSEISQRYGKKILTSIEELNEFYLAEDYHQKYRLKLRDLFRQEFREIYPRPEDLTNSTAAARVNGYLAGHGKPRLVEENIGRLGISERAQRILLDMYPD